MTQEQLLGKDILSVLPFHISSLIKKCLDKETRCLTEIRLRANQPILLVFEAKDCFVAGHTCTCEDLSYTLQIMSKYSLYAYEQEIKMGFITIQGGHRVGISGQVILEDGNILGIQNISSINIRISREFLGCAEELYSYVLAENSYVYSTLIIAPPRCGKTTILRDLIRLLSTGRGSFSGVQVGVVDERSEIASCQHGVPTVNLGPRVDVMDACPKGKGMLMLIRSMSPTVIATDELGREEDAFAVREALTAGISVLATVHGKSAIELMERPYIGEIIKNGLFDRYVILSRNPQIGTLEKVVDTKTNTLIYEKKRIAYVL